MKNSLNFYINGEWVTPRSTNSTLAVIDPSTGHAFDTIAMGGRDDVDDAVLAAKAAFPAFSNTSVTERIDLLARIVAAYDRRHDELALVMSKEMGAPRAFARTAQAGIGRAHLTKMMEVLEGFQFEAFREKLVIRKEAIGVVGMIAPWNWPMNQIICKVAPALAAGCTMVLKPSELAPLSGIVFAEILHEASVPPGVFNLVNGDGQSVGQALSVHPDIDMVSFTGSTQAGVQVAKAAADSIKRVHQELGGKSANILLSDVDLQHAVTKGVAACFSNSGQSCNAPTRMLVPEEHYEAAIAYAEVAAQDYIVGPADSPVANLGPVISMAQYEKIQTLIAVGIEEGARLVSGGLGRPEGLTSGYYVRPTIFANVTRHMRIAREEIFGPVLSMMSYQSEEEALEIANDSVYGLAAYVQTADVAKAHKMARKLRTGNVYINYPAWDAGAPFGGFKQSGNGREYAEFGLEEFLETKGIVG